MTKKRKKATYDYKKAAFIVSIGVIILIILNMIYDVKTASETWLVCSNEQHKYSNYQEVVKYRFIDDELYGFYRDEIITAENQESFDSLYKTFKETCDSLDQNKDLSYVIKAEGLELTANTYIGVLNIPNFFDGYIQSTPLTHESDLKTIEEYYTNEKYSCEISYK